jgi:AraC-like DNA-binding protein
MDLAVETADRIYYQSDHLELSSSVAQTEHYPVHRHPLQFQLEVVLHGETQCGIGRQRFPVPQHCFSIINPAVDHYNVTQRWKHAAFVIFARQTLDDTAWQMYRLLSHPVTFADVVAPCSTDLTAVMHVLFHAAAHPDRPGWRLLVDSALIQLSVVLLRSLSGNHTGRAAAAFHAGMAQTQIGRAVDLIHSNFQDDLSLDDLAAAAAMSRYHFLRCFKAQVGTTPYAYLLQVRLHTAATWLRSSSRSITDIALACGFTSSSRFSEAFRRQYQSTPSAYRHTTSH